MEYKLEKPGFFNSSSLRLERLERETNSYLDSATPVRVLVQGRVREYYPLLPD